MQTMVFKIPEEMNLELEQICKAEERSKAFLIRKSIQKFLEAKNEPRNAND
jgi:predicted transcriptional regulator